MSSNLKEYLLNSLNYGADSGRRRVPKISTVFHDSAQNIIYSTGH